MQYKFMHNYKEKGPVIHMQISLCFFKLNLFLMVYCKYL